MSGRRVDDNPTAVFPRRRGITTKSPLEAELEYQRSLEEREAQQREMRETAAAIADAKNTAATAPPSPPSSACDEKPKPKTPPRPPIPAFGAPMGTGVGGARKPSAPPAEKPKPKVTVVKAPTLGVAMHSDGRSVGGP